MWKLKVLAQWILSMLPLGERLNYALQRLKGSHSEARIGGRIPEAVRDLRNIGSLMPVDGATVLEIGTGWAPVPTLLLYLMGAKRIHTFDHVRHLRSRELQIALDQIEHHAGDIRRQLHVEKDTFRRRLQALRGKETLEEALEAAHIRYVAPGDAARTDLADGAVDLVYSHAVLEHVSEAMLRRLMAETKRVLAPGGRAYHYIGMGDHYSDEFRGVTGVNFLQYPQWVWNLFVLNKISYHNRLREKQFIEIFRQYGAEAQVLHHTVPERDVKAARTLRIDRRFSGMTPEELAVFNSAIALRFET